MSPQQEFLCWRVQELKDMVTGGDLTLDNQACLAFLSNLRKNLDIIKTARTKTHIPSATPVAGD